MGIIHFNKMLLDFIVSSIHLNNFQIVVSMHCTSIQRIDANQLEFNFSTQTAYLKYLSLNHNN